MAQRTQRYDVVVVGGGAAGIAAAVGARQSGARTLLVERYGFLGGAATNANVLSYCGFYVQGNIPRKVVGGVGTRVLEMLDRLGLDVVPVRAPSGNWIVMLDPEALKVAMDRMAGEHGIDCRLHCTLIGARRSATRIDAVTLFDHAGPFDIEAAAFVDASGDGDLGFAAAVGSTRTQASRPRQLASFPVRIGGVPPPASASRAQLTELMEHFDSGYAKAHVRSNGGHLLRLPRSNELWWMGIDCATDGLDSADLAIAERCGRDLAWRFIELLRARVPGFDKAYLCSSGPQLGIRDSRQLQTRYRLTGDDVLCGRMRDDGIACGCWPAELHQGTRGPTFQPVGGEGYYHVPLASIRAVGVDNLWIGGRVIDCEALAYGSLRVMGTAFATGQAAGIAAAHVASAANGDGDDVAWIRRELLRQGAIL